MIVEQFGLAISPACFAIASGFTSGTTSGIPSFMRNALVLSTTTAPAFTADGANSLLIEPPALKNAIFTPAKESCFSSSMTYSLPANVAVFPALRLLASSFRFAIGNFRSASTLRNSCPTAPVAPTIATLTAIALTPAKQKRRNLKRNQPHADARQNLQQPNPTPPSQVNRFT